MGINNFRPLLGDQQIFVPLLGVGSKIFISFAELFAGHSISLKTKSPLQVTVFFMYMQFCFLIGPS